MGLIVGLIIIMIIVYAVNTGYWAVIDLLIMQTRVGLSL